MKKIFTILSFLICSVIYGQTTIRVGGANGGSSTSIVAGSNITLNHTGSTYTVTGAPSGVATTVNAGSGITVSGAVSSPTIAITPNYSWNTLGNSGTTGSNFLGTTDSRSLRIRTNNTEYVTVDSVGLVGIGTVTPTQKLDVVGKISLAQPVYGNVFIGSGAGQNVGTGTTLSQYLMTGVGQNVLSQDTSQGASSAFGFEALRFNYGYANSAFGAVALKFNRTGQQNQAFGDLALGLCTSGSYNNAFGYGALSSVDSLTGSYNSAFGNEALRAVTSGQYNVGMGNNIFRLLSTGSFNVGIGAGDVGYSLTTGDQNVMIGKYTADAMTSGTRNVAIGSDALNVATTGLDNIGIGYNSGGNITTGGTNICIGYNTTVTSATADNQMNIGNVILGTGINAYDSSAVINIQGSLQITDGTQSQGAGKVFTSDANGVGSWGSIITSGTYTATLTDSANVSASTAYQWQYLRVGNVVTVSGQIDLDPTSTLTSTVEMVSLPIASDFTALSNCGGSAIAPGIAGQCASVLGTTSYSADKALIKWSCVDVTNQPFYVHFTYLIQ